MASPLTGMFEMPQQKQSFGQKAMQVVRNFGAGLAGVGPEYIMMQKQEQNQLSRDREMAMVRDAMQVKKLLDSREYDQAINLIDNRVKAISKLGGDPSDTLGLRQMIVSGNVQQASQGLDMFLSEAQSAFPEVFAPKELDPSKLIDGRYRGSVDPMTGQVSMDDVYAQGGVQAPAPQQTEAFRTLNDRAVAAGLQPGTPGYQEFMAQGGRQESAPNVREREARIQEYMSGFGLTRQEAIQRLDAQVMTDPVTGNLISYDRTSGTASLPDVATGRPPAAAPAPDPIDLSQLAFDPGKGTGAGAAFIGLYNASLGQLPFLPTIMGAETAAQQLTILERDAIKALASSTRPAVVEQERILQAIPKPMEWSQNPNIARSKMISFVDLMTNQYIDDLRYSKDLSQPKGIREESGRRAREIESIFRRVMTPEATQSMLDSINGVEADMEQVNAVPFDQLQSVQLENLSDAALDIYMERLRNGR